MSFFLSSNVNFHPIAKLHKSKHKITATEWTSNTQSKHPTKREKTFQYLKFKAHMRIEVHTYDDDGDDDDNGSRSA